jgi:hypothetical protein
MSPSLQTDTDESPDLSSGDSAGEKPEATLNYRPVLSSERTPNRKNIKTIVTKERKG